MSKSGVDELTPLGRVRVAVGHHRDGLREGPAVAGQRLHGVTVRLAGVPSGILQARVAEHLRATESIGHGRVVAVPVRLCETASVGSSRCGASSLEQLVTATRMRTRAAHRSSVPTIGASSGGAPAPTPPAGRRRDARGLAMNYNVLSTSPIRH